MAKPFSPRPGVLDYTAQDVAEVGEISKVQPTESDVSSMAGAVKTEWIDERGVRQWEVSVPLHNELGDRTRGFGDVMDAQRPVIEKQVARSAGRESRAPKVEVVNQYGVRRKVDARFEDRLVNKKTDHYCWRMRGAPLRFAIDGTLWRVGKGGYWAPTGRYTINGGPRWNGESGVVEAEGVYHDPGGQPWMFAGGEWTCLAEDSGE